jgi:hypothetical protein
MLPIFALLRVQRWRRLRVISENERKEKPGLSPQEQTSPLVGRGLVDERSVVGQGHRVHGG